MQTETNFKDSRNSQQLNEKDRRDLEECKKNPHHPRYAEFWVAGLLG